MPEPPSTEIPRPPSVRPRPVGSRTRRSRPSVRAAALAVLLVVLGAGCVVALFQFGEGRNHSVGSVSARDTGEPGARTSAPVEPPAPSTRPVVRSFTAEIGDRSGCQTLAGTVPQLLCPIPQGTVTYIEADDVEVRYRRIAGPDAGTGKRGRGTRGAPACAAGTDDERSWADPASPTTSAGRYLCRVVDGRAEMWWSADAAGVIGHASRVDDDLAALFSWWRARTEHP